MGRPFAPVSHFEAGMSRDEEPRKDLPRGWAITGPCNGGERTGGNDVPGSSAQPRTGSFDEQAAFKKFNVAVPGLLSRSAELTRKDCRRLPTSRCKPNQAPSARTLAWRIASNEQRTIVTCTHTRRFILSRGRLPRRI
jgi:hypothetical protein